MKLKELALELGIKTMDLPVSQQNRSAIKLYEKIGFETERRVMKIRLQKAGEFAGNSRPYKRKILNVFEK